MKTLTEHAEEYLVMRRGLGFKLRGHDRLISSFIEYHQTNGHEAIGAQACIKWATLPTHVQPATWSQRLCAVRGFTRYLHGMDPSVEIPSNDWLSLRRNRQRPYLYSSNDINGLLQATATLKPSFRAATYKTLFGLLAVTGMRVGEALSLDRHHVNLNAGTVYITDTKFRKNRHIPLHTSSTTALQQYARLRDERHPKTQAPSFFLSTHGSRLSYQCVNRAFHQCMSETDLENCTQNRPVRIHGLRHSFAITTLNDWYRSGVTVEAHLPILSAFLGHSCPASTYWYLQSCPQLLQLAAERAELHRSSHS